MVRLLSGLVLLVLCSACDLNDFPDDPVPTVPRVIDFDLTLLEEVSPYVLDGFSVVMPGATLTIEPGTVIEAERGECREGVSKSCAALVVSKGAYIQAAGTPEKPIIFTSERERGGEWLGLVINGDAPCNTGNDTEALGETGPYCGSNPEDSSGVLQYVIVKHAGASAIDSVLHYNSSIALHGVGRKTVVENVHAKLSLFNGITMVGGTVDVRYGIASCVAENGFSWYDGWQGRGQFWLSQQCDDRSDSGIYGANTNAFTEDLFKAPQSNPTVYNFTLVGPPNRGSGREGVEFEFGSAGLLVNGIVYNHRQKGFWVNDRETCANVDNGSLLLRHVYFAGNDRDFTNRCGENSIFLATGLGNQIGNKNLMQDPLREVNPDFRLNSDGLAILADPQPPSDPWFEQTNYIGAFGEEDWTLPLRK